MRIKGICALITGAAEGIGREVAERLLKKGAKFVAVLDVNKIKGEETTKEFADKFGTERVKFIFCDVADDDDIKRSFREAYDVYKQLDVIINNAGVRDEHPDIVKINFGSVITGSYLAKDYMSRQNGGNGGVLINTASLAGLYPYIVPRYCGTKFAVVGFSLSLSLQDSCYSQDDIRIGLICPAFVATGLSKGLEGVDFVEIGQVVDAYMLMIEDDTKHNCCIRITNKLGIDLHPVTTYDEFVKLTTAIKE